MTSYSQYAEDLHIVKAVEGVASKRLLDLGAWHPTQFSNSRALIEAGWSAVLVEPSPGPLATLARGYCDWPGVEIISAAVGFDRHLLHLSVTDDAVSTTDAETLEKWKHAGGYYGKIWASQITLEHIFGQFGGGFEFVNIDTEGTSVDVFKRLMELGQRPQCVCVEHDGRIVELFQHAESAGYRQLHLNGTNMVLGR